MALPFQLLLVVLATGLGLAALGWLVRLLMANSITGWAVLMLLRLISTAAAALALGYSVEEHKAALIFAVGVTYFAAVLVDGWRESKRFSGERKPVQQPARRLKTSGEGTV